MEEPITEPVQETNPKRPVLLTILCVLTFVGSTEDSIGGDELEFKDAVDSETHGWRQTAVASSLNIVVPKSRYVVR